MPDRRIDFAAIKKAVNIEEVCTRYGVELRNYRGNCPLPGHTGSKASFTINAKKNVFNCHSRSCAATRKYRETGGDLIAFVMAMENCSVSAAGTMLEQWFGLNGHPRPEARAPNPKPEPEAEVNIPLAVKYPGFQALKDVAYHDYLATRGISKETADAFGVGYFPGKSSWLADHRIVIPIHNEKGKLLGYAGRAHDGAEPKYLFPKGFRKGLELYNLHRIPADAEEVVITEGFFDAMKVYQAGYNAVALMGCSLSEAQEKLLMRFKCLTLFLDGDDPGKAASATLLARLARTRFVRNINPNDKQPDQLGPEEVQSLLG
ncbi:MAG TPA: toprim domain-containing protein [Bdellovibrionota bacterium]|nr:toprim domain-containing protein [Bdellovibrionota bacterium]